MCHHVFIYEEDTNSQTNVSIKYISNTYEGVKQNKIYFRVYVRILIYERGCEIDNYNY